MSNITIYKSTVDAGKSMDCCRAIHNYEKNNIPILKFVSGVVAPINGPNTIWSRMGFKTDALSIYDKDDLEKIVKEMTPKPYCVIGDECQFLTIEQCNQLFRIAHDPKINIPVICYLLNGTSQQTFFVGTAQLTSFADHILEVITVCWCGDRAMMSGRISDGKFVEGGDIVQVSSSDYIPLCGKHYFLKDIGPYAH
ncbi:MAG: hypothetical protein WC606_03930 [Candidatus Absconditabacterales bacterium]|jgi:thymidine kinase